MQLLIDPEVKPNVYRALWTAKIPERVRIFLWLLIKDRLPTTRNFASKN
jgi:zinc-binding in reverse transcriptase